MKALGIASTTCSISDSGEIASTLSSSSSSTRASIAAVVAGRIRRSISASVTKSAALAATTSARISATKPIRLLNRPRFAPHTTHNTITAAAAASVIIAGKDNKGHLLSMGKRVFPAVYGKKRQAAVPVRTRAVPSSSIITRPA